jgi:hypothetical protein
VWYNRGRGIAWPGATTTLRREVEMKESIQWLRARVSSVLRTVYKKVRALRRHSRKRWSAYTITLLIEVFATMVGVFAGLELSDRWQQRRLDSNTAQRLHLAVIESIYNKDLAIKLLEDLSEGTPNDTIWLDQVKTSSAMAATNDQNVVSHVPLHHITLLFSYVHAQQRLESTLALCKDYVLFVTEKDSKTKDDLLKIIGNNASAAAAMCDALQKELPVYYDKTRHDQAEHDAIQNYIQEQADRYREKYDYLQEGE